MYHKSGHPVEPLIEIALTERKWRLLAQSMEILFEGFNSWPDSLMSEFSSFYDFYVGQFMIDEDGPEPDFTSRPLERFAGRALTQAEYQPLVDKLVEQSGGREQLSRAIREEVTDPTNKRGAEVRKELQRLVPVSSSRPLIIETDFFLWGFFLGASSSVAAFYTNSAHTQPLWDVLTRVNPSLLDTLRPDDPQSSQRALEMRELVHSLWVQGDRQLRA